MAQKDSIAELSSLLKNYEQVITYLPLRTEVDISAFITDVANPHLIPPRAGLDPFEIAEQIKAEVGSDSAVILIPGRQFDAAGTRHGQGGAWYDRFLSAVPREWLRIGFCYDSQFSPNPIVRQSWDQAMDYVVVVDRTSTGVSVYSSE